MKEKYDAIMIYDDRTVCSRSDLINELRKLLEGSKYNDTFILTNNNAVIINTIRIKMLTFFEFAKLCYEEHNCIVCPPPSGISSNAVSALFNHMIDKIISIKNRKELDDEREDSNSMHETTFPVINETHTHPIIDLIREGASSNTIKEKLNIAFGCHIEKVIFNPKATIVFWSDHTKTIVKLDKDDKRDDEKGLAMAISKKFLGNKGNYYNEFRKWLK